MLSDRVVLGRMEDEEKSEVCLMGEEEEEEEEGKSWTDGRWRGRKQEVVAREQLKDGR